MKIAVWDTYVVRKDGIVMHFDILVPEEIKNEDRIYDWGREYLDTKSFETGELTSKECKFCHIEKASEKVKRDIENLGYSILEMQNCT